MNIRASVAVGASVATLLFGAPAASASTPTIAYGTTGADVSWPQCSGSAAGPMPSGSSASFGIVGVNDGRPGTANPCYGGEMTWASGVNSSSSAPAQVYLNTADPGNTAADWPTTGSNTYGSCTTVRSRGKTAGANSQACAYQYGVQEAQYAQGLMAAGTAPQVVWLDVETANTWQTRKLQPLNQAVLDGMVDTLAGYTYTVGVYATSYQWNKILGNLDQTSTQTLGGLIEWIPTGLSSASVSDCTTLPTFTTGGVQFVQYTSTYDYDIACQAAGSI